MPFMGQNNQAAGGSEIGALIETDRSCAALAGCLSRDERHILDQADYPDLFGVIGIQPDYYGVGQGAWSPQTLDGGGRSVYYKDGIWIAVSVGGKVHTTRDPKGDWTLRYDAGLAGSWPRGFGELNGDIFCVTRKDYQHDHSYILRPVTDDIEGDWEHISLGGSLIDGVTSLGDYVAYHIGDGLGGFAGFTITSDPAVFGAYKAGFKAIGADDAGNYVLSAFGYIYTSQTPEDVNSWVYDATTTQIHATAFTYHDGDIWAFTPSGSWRSSNQGTGFIFKDVLILPGSVEKLVMTHDGFFAKTVNRACIHISFEGDVERLLNAQGAPLVCLDIAGSDITVAASILTGVVGQEEVYVHNRQTYDPASEFTLPPLIHPVNSLKYQVRAR